MKILITIVNKESFLKSIQSEIDDFAKSSNGCAIDMTAEDISFAILAMIFDNELIEHFILDDDKDGIELLFSMSTYKEADGYAIFLRRNINGILTNILKLQLLTNDMETVENFVEGDIFIIYPFQTFGKGSKDRILFFRNKISILPNISIIKEKYDLIKNILSGFPKKINYASGYYNYLLLNTENISVETIFDNTFSEEFLINNISSDEDRDYFENILNYSPLQAKLETIWLYYGKSLRDMGFEDKKEIILVEDFLNEIRRDLTEFDINVIFDLKEGAIKLYFNTDLEYPLNQVFVKIDKNNSIQGVLTKNLYLPPLTNYENDKKVENITLNDFIENNKEVLSLIKLFLY